MEAHDLPPETVPVVVSLAGELDAADDGWAAALEHAIDGGARHVVVDMLNVSFLDSSVVRALVLARRRVSDDGWVRLVYTHHLIRRVIDICGLTELLPQFTTLEAALRGAPTRQHPTDGRSPGVAGHRQVLERTAATATDADISQGCGHDEV